MPRNQANGTSTNTLQRLGSFDVANTFWEVRLGSNPQQDRLERIGTLLHVVPISNGRFPVIAAYKFFGAGIRPPAVNIPTYAGTEVWMVWFKAGVLWVFERESV